MKYSDLVQSNQNFHSSVNLQFDLNKEEKINSYIPTKQSVAILKRYLNSVYNDSYNEDNATVLIGPYGRGKSHLLLILTAIMSCNKNNCSEAIDALVKRLSDEDPETGELAEMIISRKKPFIPVLINSNHTNINQSFIVALREALEYADLSDFFPQTYFDASIDMISTWEENFSNAYETFKSELKKQKIQIDDFKSLLHKCDHNAYRAFCDIYPIISNGASFNPLQNTDVVKMYNQVAEALIDTGEYGGLFIIFDEFSKFLSSDSAMSDKQNLKLIQDFSESAVRSNSIHICFITHKEILDYSQSEDFRTVDGRLKKVYFIASAEQSYELVANALTQNELFYDFYSEHISCFESVGQRSLMTGLFKDVSDEIFENVLLKGCFPILTISVFLLIRISELIGQNERTLFTFLSQSEECSLVPFLERDIDNDDIEFLTPDRIYDYFSELFRVEVFNPKVHSIWSKTRAAIARCSFDYQKSIIKTLALCLMIRDDRFTASDVNLKAASGLSDNEYLKTIDSLCSSHIITKRRSGTYAFLTPNGVDIKKNIQNMIEQGVVKLDRTRVLEKAFSEQFILPRQHNSKHNIMRYFAVTFMEADDFWNYHGDFQEIKKQADGLIVYLVSDKFENAEKVAQCLKDRNVPKNVLVCSSNAWQDDSLISEYQATCLLETQSDAQTDDHFREELQVYAYDLFKSIRQIADKTFSASDPNTIYCNSERCFDSISKSMILNRELSQICDEYYCATPSINNEMVNKTKLTAQIKKARIKVIDAVLEASESIELMDGFGPEVSLLRSTIFVKNLNNGINTTDENLRTILAEIDSIAASSEEKKVSFSKIYTKLQSAPYGMRSGVIPIYIAYVFRKKKDSVIVTYKNREVPLNGELLSQVENAPLDYYFCLEKGTQEKTDYLNALFFGFSFSEDPRPEINARVIVDLMQKWFRGLCKFTRDHSVVYSKDSEQKIPPEFMKLKKPLLQYDVNPHEFLFEIIPNIFGTDNLHEVSERIVAFKRDYDSFLESAKFAFAERVKELFDRSISGSLASIMSDWYEHLPDSTRNHVFSSDINELLHFIRNNDTHDDIIAFERLAKRMTMLAVEDWSENTASEFFCDIDKYIKTVNEYTEARNADQGVKMSLDFGGTVYERNIETTEISGIAETALNNVESALTEYGDAITAQERIALLLKLLKHEIDQL